MVDHFQWRERQRPGARRSSANGGRAQSRSSGRGSGPQLQRQGLHGGDAAGVDADGRNRLNQGVAATALPAGRDQGVERHRGVNRVEPQGSANPARLLLDAIDASAGGGHQRACANDRLAQGVERGGVPTGLDRRRGRGHKGTPVGAERTRDRRMAGRFRAGVRVVNAGATSIRSAKEAAGKGSRDERRDRAVSRCASIVR